tara:strand:- start:24 stop:215 length:192 start_codon:yes stop_codon:yes gene_type:complete
MNKGEELISSPIKQLKLNKKKGMIQPLIISSVISAISVVAAKKFLRREPKMQKVLERRRLDPT